MEEKIKQVMASVFEVPVDSIHEMSSADNIENWDSLHHMNLVVALEEEFKVSFDDEQIANLLNYQLIKLTLTELITT
jgi:acyl carrier protein